MAECIEFLPYLGDAICACGIFCWAGFKVGQVALTAYKDATVRRPCNEGLACKKCALKHLAEYSHPDDDDYGFSIRVHGGKGQFCTLRQCFNFMDPQQQGYVKEHAALRVLLDHLDAAAEQQTPSRGKRRKKQWSDKEVASLWKAIDTDGNKYISFPEFVEWASMPNPDLHLPQPVGIIGPKGLAGQYCLQCTVEGCGCANFTPSETGGRFCKCCNHKRGYHTGSRRDQILAVLPDSWATAMSSFDFAAIVGQKRLQPCGEDVVQQVQRLVDDSHRRIWTRDRSRGVRPASKEAALAEVPSGYTVVRVERNENVRLWLKYVVKRTLILEALAAQQADGRMAAPTVFKMLTSESARTLPFLEDHRPLEDKNEWFLWHGASSQGIKSIAQQEFKQLHAGCNTGTLYGAGTYLSDSCTKADEYAVPSTEGEDEGLCCLLLCRVMGGRVRYTDEVVPNGEELVREVLEGPYDCVFGDREKCKQTFKEICVYESNQAYPEYLVYYRRRYD